MHRRSFIYSSQVNCWFDQPTYYFALLNYVFYCESKKNHFFYLFLVIITSSKYTLSKHSLKVVIGNMIDMNTKLEQKEGYRPTIGRKSLHSMPNDNGTRFINFMVSRDINLSSTYPQYF